jgi:predicted component of type VI protein secretion system
MPVLLTLSVISENAAQLGLGGYKVFDERGGDIGRLDSSHWMLRDPDHLVSARHARIFFDQRGFFLEDTSTNGTFVNDPDRPVPRDAPLPLHDGDRLFIGSFEILVQVIEELPVMVAQTSATIPLDLPAFSARDRVAAAEASSGHHKGKSATSTPDRAAALAPPNSDAQLQAIARAAVSGAMEALKARDEALQSLGIPVSGPHAPGIDPLAGWPGDPAHAVRRLLARDPATKLPADALAEAFHEISVHQRATLAAMRAACDGMFARLNLDRNMERHVRALFANEFARTYAEQMYEQRAGAARRS